MIRILFTCSLYLFVAVTFGQSKDELSNLNEQKEKVLLVSDRDSYVVNEILNFKAFNTSDSELKQLEWSKVLYVELVTNKGVSLLHRKFMFGKDGGSGAFKIPASILTGNYYLKAYTKWMRNFSNKHYFYKPITIVNPYNDKVFEITNGYTSDFVIDTVEFKNIGCCNELDDKKGERKSKNLIYVEIQSNLSSNHEPSFNRGNDTKSTQYKLSCPLEKKQDSFASETCIVSVARCKETPYLVCKLKDGAIDNNASFEFAPETRGVTLSGTLISKADRAKVKNSWVFLAVIGENKESLSVLTDSLGRFTFSLPALEGEIELFISADASVGAYEILVDNDFCTKPVNLPYLPFKMNDNWDHFNKMSLNMQIKNQYATVVISKDSLKMDSIIYYNKPTAIVKFADYIILPSIQDYFQEFLPEVNIDDIKGEKSINIIGDWSEMSIYKPLILVDHLIVTDIDAFLGISPEKIQQIEVLAEPYIYGNMTYGGVINVYSSQNDLASFDLPEDGLFFSYKVFSEDKISRKAELSSNILAIDVSNTLYWNPNFPIKDSTLSIDLDNNTGDYLLRLIHVDENGELYMVKKTITIE